MVKMQKHREETIAPVAPIILIDKPSASEFRTFTIKNILRPYLPLLLVFDVIFQFLFLKEFELNDDPTAEIAFILLSELSHVAGAIIFLPYVWVACKPQMIFLGISAAALSVVISTATYTLLYPHILGISLQEAISEKGDVIKYNTYQNAALWTIAFMCCRWRLAKFLAAKRRTAPKERGAFQISSIKPRRILYYFNAMTGLLERTLTSEFDISTIEVSNSADERKFLFIGYFSFMKWVIRTGKFRAIILFSHIFILYSDTPLLTDLPTATLVLVLFLWLIFQLGLARFFFPMLSATHSFKDLPGYFLIIICSLTASIGCVSLLLLATYISGSSPLTQENVILASFLFTMVFVGDWTLAYYIFRPEYFLLGKYLRKSWKKRSEERSPIKIPLNLIKTVQAQGNYVVVFSENDRHMIRLTLKKVAEELEGLGTLVHRSTWVSFSEFASLHKDGGSFWLTTKSGHLVPVSRGRLRKVQEVIEKENL